MKIADRVLKSTYLKVLILLAQRILQTLLAFVPKEILTY